MLKRVNRFAKISTVFVIYLLVKNAKVFNFFFEKSHFFVSRKNAKFSRNKKCENFANKFLIMIYLIKCLMLSSHSREFPKFFCAINYCNYGFCGFFPPRNTKKKFRFFSRKFSVAGNPRSWTWPLLTEKLKVL